jgi:hypothetical protein
MWEDPEEDAPQEAMLPLIGIPLLGLSEGGRGVGAEPEHARLVVGEPERVQGKACGPVCLEDLQTGERLLGPGL